MSLFQRSIDWIFDSLTKTYFALLVGGFLVGVSLALAADLTSTPTSLAPGDETVLHGYITGTATSLTLEPVVKYVNAVKTKGCVNSTSGFAVLQDTSRTEWISFGTVSCNSTTNISTVSSIRRGLSPTAVSFAGGTGMSFDAGTKFRVIDYPILYNNSLYKDIVNSLSGIGRITGTVTGSSLINLPPVTTAQRDAFTTVANGDVINNSTTGTLQQRLSGAWTDIGSSTTANATTLASGKVQLGKLFDNTGATITDSATGAPTVMQTRYLTQTGGTSAYYGFGPILSRQGTLTGSLLGLPKSQAKANRFLSGTGGWVPLPATTQTVKTVYVSGASSTSLVNPSADAPFDTHTYTIPASDLITGVTYSFRCAYSGTYAAGTIKLSIKIGNAVLASGLFTPGGGGGVTNGIFDGAIVGTAAAGASVPVRSVVSLSDITTGQSVGGYSSTNIPTNQGTGLLLRFGATAASTNPLALTMCSIYKASTTAF